MNKVMALRKIAEGILDYANALEAEKTGVCEAPAVAEKKEAVKKTATKPVEVEETATEEADEEKEVTREDLEKLSFNQLRKMAKDMGVDSTGTKPTLIERLLGATTDDTAETGDDEPVEEETTAEETVEEVEEETEEPSVEEQVKEAVSDMTDADIKELLESYEIPVKKGAKRLALIKLVVTAVEDGVISLDEEDEETDGEETAETEEAEESADITENMTKKRKKAFEALCDETAESIESGDITREDIIEFINGYNEEEADYEDVDDEDLTHMYFEIMANFIDDDGNVIETEDGEEGEAYYINDVPYCCGKELKLDKKHKTYKCSVCGAEFDAE